MKARLRRTAYAEELARTTQGENRVERLRINATKQEEIRISWWPSGRMANRPADMPEQMLARLLGQGISDGTLSPQFLEQLTEAARAKA